MRATCLGPARVSVAGPTVRPVHDEDSVHPDDALLQAALAATAEYVHDPAKKDLILDFVMTARPLAEWSKDELQILMRICEYPAGLARMSRETDERTGSKPPQQEPDRG
jgi:hypothetical protein